MKPTAVKGDVLLAFWMTPQQTLDVGALSLTWLLSFEDVCPAGWALATEGR